MKMHFTGIEQAGNWLRTGLELAGKSEGCGWYSVEFGPACPVGRFEV